MLERPLSHYWTSPLNYFASNAVLQEADTMNETGGVIWQLALSLLVAWIIVYLCLVRGIKSSGKVGWTWKLAIHEICLIYNGCYS